MVMAPPVKLTSPAIEFDEAAGAPAVRFEVFPAPPTVRPESPTRDTSELGNEIASAKLSPANGRIVNVPEVFILSGHEELWLVKRLPTKRMSPLANPDGVAPMFVAPLLMRLNQAPLFPVR
jgi:hypothetical protein